MGLRNKNTGSVRDYSCWNNTEWKYLQGGEHQVPSSTQDAAMTVGKTEDRPHALQILGCEHYWSLLCTYIHINTQHQNFAMSNTHNRPISLPSSITNGTYQ